MDRFDYPGFTAKLPDGKGILGREKFFNPVIFVPFIDIGGQWHLLFQERSANIRQPGEVSFPGGGFSSRKDKNCMDTAIRETVEELGVSKSDISIEGRLDSIVVPMGAIIEIFTGRILNSDITSYRINRDEVARVFTIPFAWFLDSHCETYKVRLEVQPYIKNSTGETEIIFPAKELGLPERYSEPWGGLLHDVYVYRTGEGIIWGLTAQIVKELVRIAKK